MFECVIKSDNNIKYFYLKCVFMCSDYWLGFVVCYWILDVIDFLYKNYEKYIFNVNIK